MREKMRGSSPFINEKESNFFNYCVYAGKIHECVNASF
jgi:hypothetical protein